MSGFFDFVGNLVGGGDKPPEPAPLPPSPEEDPAAVAARQEEAERLRISQPQGRAANILAGDPLTDEDATELILG